MTNCINCEHCKYDLGWGFYYCTKDNRMPFDVDRLQEWDAFTDPADCNDFSIMED